LLGVEQGVFQLMLEDVEVVELVDILLEQLL
jgi:hypothetical protein